LLSIVLSILSLPMSFGALTVPVPIGIAACMTGFVALVLGKGELWPTLAALFALILGIAGLIVGLTAGVLG
jgi:hypothetical protein